MIPFVLPMHAVESGAASTCERVLTPRAAAAGLLRCCRPLAALAPARRWALVQTRLSRFGHGDFNRRALRFPFLLRRHGSSRPSAENLAWSLGPHSTPRQIVWAWMRSPAHRATILGHWRDGAVATIADTPMPGLQTSGVTAVQHFGR